jgi:FkbM family methyltransferase
MWFGCYEPEVGAILTEVLRPGEVFLDVGAHIGYFAALGAGAVGPTGEVHAFEADPQVFERLETNGQGLANLRRHLLSLWDEQGQRLTFYRAPTRNSGWGSLVWKDARRERVSVTTSTLDDWAERTGLENVDVIKVDTEGAEPQILSGAREILETWHPLLLLEADSALLHANGLTRDRLIDDLMRYGYVVFLCNPEGSTLLCLGTEDVRDRLTGLQKLGLPGWRLATRPSS